MADPLQMILFGNNAIEVAFSDSTKLQMSACGTTFVHDSPTTREAHPLHGMSRITQRTQFTTSEFHDKVTKALEFRNLFAERPFLCQERVPKDLIETLYEDIKEVKWPTTPSDATSSIRKYDKCSIRITSLDGHAHVTLSPHGKDFTVQYRTKLSQPLSREKSRVRLRNRPGMNSFDSDTSSENGEPKEGVNNEENQNTQGQKVRWCYTWSIQYHSVASCPESWKHPLDLLMAYYEKMDQGGSIDGITEDTQSENDVGKKEENESNENGELVFEESKELQEVSEGNQTSDPVLKNGEPNYVMISLPVALPLQCSRHHLHRWRKPDNTNDYDTDAEACCFYGRVRVICSEGVIYRLAHSGSKLLEIYPGDGSIIISKNFNSDFFIHYIMKGDQVEERTYSIRTPPPNSCNFSYSVQKLIKRGYRIMRCVAEAAAVRSRPEDPPCWQDQEDIIKPPPTVLDAEQTVQGVGKFSAYSNGKVRIVFTDRASLDMTVGLERGRKQAEVLGEKFDTRQIMPSLCRMFMPTGHYSQVQTHDPGDCRGYIDYAEKWVEWLITPKERRADVFGEDLDGNKRKMSVHKELQKIKCFNYILDNVVLNSPEPEAHGGAMDKHQTLSNTFSSNMDEMSTMSMAAIQEILKKTSQTISDIDTFCGGTKLT